MIMNHDKLIPMTPEKPSTAQIVGMIACFLAGAILVALIL
jgi:hypothetical protein